METVCPRRGRSVAFAGLSCFVLSMVSMFIGCGSAPPHVPTLTLTPSATSIRVNATQHFQVPGYSSSDVQEWAVEGIPGGNAEVGTIDINGVYKAPAVPPTPNSVTVAALSPLFSARGDISVVNPEPKITTVAPDVAMQGTSSLLVKVTGSSFASRSQVIADGVPLPTKFLSSTSLQARLPAAVLATAGARSIHIVTPQPGGGASEPLALTVMANGAVRPSGNPLVALYDIEPPRDAKVMIEFGPDTQYGRNTWEVATPSGGGAVEIQVAGMIPASTYHMRAHVTFADGTSLVDADRIFTTGAVPPSRFANVKITRFPGMTPSPGVELLDLISPAPATNSLQASAFDLDGQPVWYYDAEPGATVIPLKLLSNGHFLFDVVYPDHLNDSLREIDLAGNTIRDFKRADLNQALAAHGFALSLEQFHHDVLPLPNGHIILLSNMTKQIDGLAGYSGPTAVQGDVLVDLDPDLVPVWTWSTFDHLDPNRHLMGLPDWTHSNAVLYTPNDGNLLLSMRHQSWVIKIDYANGTGSGAILWRFGDEGDFTLASGDRSAWQYGQHYPRIVSINGSQLRLGVMDNGNGRMMDASGTRCGDPSAPACYTRLAVLDIDEASRIVTPVWEYRPGFYSFWGGSIEFLGNGDIEGAFSAAAPGSRIVELTPGDNPQPVWQLELSAESAYRGFRIPSLYPGVQW